MKRILLTGGTGFVGRHLLPLLEKDEVHVFDKTCGDYSGVNWHEIDLSDIEKMRKLMAEVKPTHLLHTAWFVPPQEFWTSPENVAWIYRSFELLRSFAENGGKRVLFIGSCAEYDWTKDETLDEETTPLKPSTLYGIAKKSLFELSTEFARQNNVSFAWARLFFMFGEGEPKGKFVRYLIDCLANNQRAICKNGVLIRDYMCISEVATALKLLFESDIEGPINIASGKATRIGDLANLVGEIIGKPHLIEVNSAENFTEPSSIIANTSRLQNEIGWKPKLSLENSLRNYLNENHRS
jgi:nucleoside-diphosphate-sugar epimerase